jgi:hypothetical protein
LSWVYGQQIWDGLMSEINNEYGVAGLMGNLQAESGLIPYRLQGDFSSGYITSINYTADVDNGIISEYDFVNNGPNGGGYGLAQWTFYTRKQALYNMKQSMSVSIGNIDLAITFLLYELNNSYTSVMNTLKNALSIREASDVVLHDFERPADQSESVEIYRASLGQAIYDEYAESEPPVDPPSNYPKASKGKAYLFIRKRRLTIT